MRRLTLLSKPAAKFIGARSEIETDGVAPFQHYLNVLRRRKWLVLLPLVVLPLVTVVASLRQETLYQASAGVLLNRQDLAATSLIGDTPPVEDVGRFAETQARLAYVPDVAARVLEAAGVRDRTVRDLLRRTRVGPNADVLTFTVTDASPALAARLASEYARQFTRYRRELDTRTLSSTRSEIEARIAELEARSQQTSPLYASLVDKAEELRTLEALKTSNVFVVQTAQAGDAFEVAPRPLRNGVLALLLGIVIGVGLAFLREALDARVRSVEQLEEWFGSPLLACLPEPPDRLVKEDRLIMLDSPSSAEAQAFHLLRMKLELANLGSRARTILVTSAVEREGKSTTAANLAVALARSGRRVMLVDLDLRRPSLTRLFRLEDRPGITSVALGHCRLEEAIASIPIAESHRAAVAASNGYGGFGGLLEIVGSGPIPPHPSELTGSAALEQILGELRERADLVLIDSAPLLAVPDTIGLGARVDAILHVASLKLARRPLLAEIRRLLETCPAAKLGFVLTGVSDRGGYGYRRGSRYGDRDSRTSVPELVA